MPQVTTMPDNCGGDALGAEQAPRRDETKRTQESEKMMLAMAEEAATLLKMVKHYPKMWEHESMKAFRDLAYEITGDPQKYRPETEEEGFGEGTECLTKDIGALLFGKQLSIMEAKTDAIYLQITHAESNSGSRDIAGTTVNVRKWKFMAVDGDGKSIVLRIDSTLNTAGNLLTPGTIVKVLNSLPVYFRYKEAEETKCALVVREFEVVGRRSLAAEFVEAPKERVKPAKKKKPPAKRARATKAAPAKSDGCACAGEQCSKDGVEFVTCITQCIPIESCPSRWWPGSACLQPGSYRKCRRGTRGSCSTIITRQLCTNFTARGIEWSCPNAS